MLYRPNAGVAQQTVVKDLEAKGCTVHRRGWPDLLVETPTGIRLIEVKAISYHGRKRQKETIRPEQKIVHRLLKMLGLEVEVVYVDLKQVCQ